MSMLAELVELVIGVDTHADTHTAALVATGNGALLATITVAADGDGYAALLALAEQHGGLRAWAIEGTSGYGAGLARHLATVEELIIELDRPVRPARRAGAKSDVIDAERAARDALARTELTAPKTGPERAALAALLVARRSAVDAAATAQRQLRALVITAPEQVRARFRGHTTHAMVAIAARVRPGAVKPGAVKPGAVKPGAVDEVEVFTVLSTLRALARRIRALEAEANEHEQAIRAIVRSWRPDLLKLIGVGPIVAAVVLTAWSHPGRCHSEAAFAMLAGAAPIPASSGKTVRYRLNRSGNRQLNRALHVIVLTRLQHDPDTRAYADKRRSQAKTDREIKRCLKRYIARQLYRQLENPPTSAARAA